MYDIYSKFDAKLHKETYTNYLEVIIDEQGTVHYAVPSHQEKLTKLACQRLQISRSELETARPIQYYGNYIEWLSMQAHAIAVWNEFCSKSYCNHKQQAILKKLKIEGIYFGTIPKIKDKEKSMNINLYQIPCNEHTKNVIFKPLPKGQDCIDSSIYKKIYTAAFSNDKVTSLEDLYRIFNIEQPADYKGRSMSVSDVVEVAGMDHTPDGFYYCNDIGFNKIHFENMPILNNGEPTEQDWETLKTELFNAGYDAISDFLGYDYDGTEDKNITDNRLNEVFEQMPNDEFAKYLITFNKRKEENIL